MTKKTVTWILIADGAQARLYANDGAGLGLYRATGREYSAPLPSKTGDVVTDQEGRASNPAGAGHHVLEPQTDPRSHIEAEFLRGIASILNDAARDKSFEHLVLVAAPKALGMLRGKLAPQTTAKVSKELDKDLIHLSERDLEQYLTEAGVLH